MDEELTGISGITMDILTGFAVSLGIGFLLGLEREFSKKQKMSGEQFAGLRTFTLVCIFGFLSAFFSAKMGQFIFPVALASLSAFIISSYIKSSADPENKGGTTEIALIITFLLGGLVFMKFILFAIIIMVVMIFLLNFKFHLHSFVKKLTAEELRAMVLFVVMSALVIPFLPDNNFGPYDLWNLKEIWKMVVLVSGMSLVGYMVSKIMGNKGTIMAGVIGGLVSSTSVSLTFSRKSKEAEASKGAAFFYAIGIIAACTIMFPRILFEVYVVNRDLAQHLWLPVILLVAAGALGAFIIYKRKKGTVNNEALPLKNPLDLATAIKFALLFAAIQWLVKYSSDNFGDNGTYLAGAISGITDVDAITLSMAKMAKGTENSMLAIHTILIAALSNTLVKFLIIIIVGSRELKRIALLGFALIFLTGVAYFIFSLISNGIS